MMIKITFPDGSNKEFDAGITLEDIAGGISSGLKKQAVAGYVNDELFDFNRPIEADASIRILTKADKESFSVLNHSSAHLLAQAVKNLYPKANFGVGPSIEEGFYYDISTNDEPIREEDLARIEAEMRKLSGGAFEMVRRVVSKDEARKMFAHDKYKLELINDLPDSDIITIYTQGEFTDLCRGGHVGNTKYIQYFKLLSIAGAYWRGNVKNEQLQRLYGTAWFSKEDLQAHLHLLEERKLYDHRKVGKEMRLFEIVPEAGQGLPLLLPKGAAIRHELEKYVYELERQAGYLHIHTPVLGSKWLYETSGHWNNYRENMFPVMEREGEELILRPMSCPHHMLVYKSDMRSYRDLPLRYAEIVTQHRYEASGALTGLERVRAMTLTDAHLFVREDQIKDEVKAAYELVIQAIHDLGLEIEYVELALRNDEKSKFHDNQELWNIAESMMRDILQEMNVEYVEMLGEAAFYGPKIDIQVRTMMGHVITLSTVQLDFLLPERFDLTYVAEDGSKVRPVVIHRGLISTWERLLAILIEQYRGAFPLWLAPVQAVVIPVNNEFHYDYAKQIQQQLFKRGHRVELDARDEKLGYKIRQSQTQKVNYQIVIGNDEVEHESVTVRAYGSQDQNTYSLDAFIQLFEAEIANKQKI
jgi:threonyl-tRNA synthetase